MPPRRDDEAVFTGVFGQHRRAVHAYFLGRVADPELARDLLQETFLRVWRRLSEVGPLPDDRQRAWIFTVARNLAVDSYRAAAARQAAEAALRQAAWTREDRVAGPERQVELGERLAQLDAAIGEALGEPAGTVRYRLSQARKQLAAELDLEDPR
jgi:RNA polymerase sigma-70 factor (ECF subfamily)